MLNLLEVVKNNNFNIVFYFVLVLVLLIGILVTYLQVFVKPLSKKKALKENIIYQHSEDVIEESYKDYKRPKKKKK